MQNTLKCNERWRIWVHRTFKIEIQKGGPNNSDILQNWFPPEIRSPLFNLYKFQDSSKSTPESCRIHWNVMNDEEIGSRKLLKLKYRRGDQIVHLFCIIGSSQEIKPPQLIQLFCKIGFPPHLWKLGTVFNLREFQKTGEN